MSLRRRLTLFFVLIVIVPLALAGFAVQRVVANEMARRAADDLEPALDTTVALYRRDAGAADDHLARLLVEPGRLARVLESGRRAAADDYLAGSLARARAFDFLGIVDPSGRVLAFARASRPQLLPGVGVPAATRLVTPRTGLGPGYARTVSIPLQDEGGGHAGTLVGGVWLDHGFLAQLPQQAGVESSLAWRGRIIATTLPLNAPAPVDVRPGELGEVALEDGSTAAARALSDDLVVLASTPTEPVDHLSRNVLVSVLTLLALVLAGTFVLAWFLSRLITHPLEELAAGARAIADGRFDYAIPVRSNDEVGRLATVFNEMTERLHATISELSSSRDQLARAVRRVGETLRATHDMGDLRASILNVAADAVGADAAALWLFTPTRDELYIALTRGLDESTQARVRVGDGIAGLVAERGRTVLAPRPDGAPKRARVEPPFESTIAVPLYTQDRVTGVLTLWRTADRPRFTEEDLGTAVFLSEQGGVAIENVLLHEEAQRLSLTDGLTGVWNRRFVQMQFRQTFATATRFGRPFSILMLDLDRFKHVNDTFGHQRGDAVLVEFAQRVSGVLREIDTFGRYGGEEFVCLLAETDVEGARATAEKVRHVIRSEPFGGPGERGIGLTVSIGVASYPEHGDSFRSLVESADSALYVAKQEGRDRVYVAGGPEKQEKLKLAT
ncbi:MAG TPA: diguanylate cyclase [Actinomycetota bacterium]|nr:diguanylate cyclase [Actinomycetota bacterium]